MLSLVTLCPYFKNYIHIFAMLIAPYRISVSGIGSYGSQNIGYRISDEISHRTIPDVMLDKLSNSAYYIISINYIATLCYLKVISSIQNMIKMHTDSLFTKHMVEIYETDDFTNSTLDLIKNAGLTK